MIEAPWSDHWRFPEGVTYLNHGSFGPAPRSVRAAQRRWREAMDDQPMDFYTRRHEPAWRAARAAVAAFVGSPPERLALVDNATYAMNVVAKAFPLQPRDEVLATDHVYGAVRRIWQRACDAADAEWREVRLPSAIESSEQIRDAIVAAMNERTRLLVISHITSATALLLPLEAILAEAKRRNIAVCIDGPHAVAQIDLNLAELGCDFYCRPVATSGSRRRSERALFTRRNRGSPTCSRRFRVGAC